MNPEVFSSLNVYPLDKADCDEAEPSSRPAAPDGFQSESTQSSHCSSNGTEELEISALLSRSSFGGEDSLPSTTPSPPNVLQLEAGPHTAQPEGGRAGNEVEAGVNQQDEAYVTMSSFYQIKQVELNIPAGLSGPESKLVQVLRGPLQEPQKY